MKPQNDISDQVLETRIQQLQEYRDYLFQLRDYSLKLPDLQQAELNQKIRRIADLLTLEAEKLREWNAERGVLH